MERSKTIRAVIFALVALCAVSCFRSDPESIGEHSALDTPSVAIDSTTPEGGIDTSMFDVSSRMVRLKNDTFPDPSGRVFNLMVTGLDARVGDYSKRADANHLIRFFLDTGCIEIISIPRDTYADAGFDDTTTFNKLTNVRAHLGRRAYLDAVSQITGVEPIDHHVEFGFSQAIGLIELLGYKDNASKTLRVLRDRTTFRAGDFQRSYNQGRFIRRVLLKNADRLDDIVGEFALRAALMMVETNLTYDKCQSVFDDLRAHGFSSSDPGRIWVRLEPPVVMQLQALSFAPASIDSAHMRLEQKLREKGLDTAMAKKPSFNARLEELIASAVADSAEHPKRVVKKLRRPYDQRVWLQSTDSLKRSTYRNSIGTLLANAYVKIGLESYAQKVQTYIKNEEFLIEGR